MHKITNIDINNKTGDCSTCGRVKVKLRERFKKNGEIKGECTNLIKKHTLNYRIKNTNKIKVSQLKYYGIKGITDEILNNYNKCTHCHCCGIKKSNLIHPLHIDHCHQTGKIRGFLCRDCNIGLGFFKDSVEVLNKAIDYLIKQNSP